MDSKTLEAREKFVQNLMTLERKKAFHVNLSPVIYTALRIETIKRDITLTDVMDEVMTRIYEQDKMMMDLLDDIAERKDPFKSKRLNRITSDALYDAIASEGKVR